MSDATIQKIHDALQEHAVDVYGEDTMLTEWAVVANTVELETADQHSHYMTPQSNLMASHQVKGLFLHGLDLVRREEGV